MMSLIAHRHASAATHCSSGFADASNMRSGPERRSLLMMVRQSKVRHLMMFAWLV